MILMTFYIIYTLNRAHTDPGAINTYICNICNKSFAVKSYYEQHKLKHQKMIIKNDTDNKVC